MGAPDFTHPLPADLYDAPGPDVLDYIRDNDAATASWLEGLDPPGKVAGFKRLNAGLIEEWNGTAWVPKPLAYIPLTGTSTATGSLSTTLATGPGGYSVKITDAPADKRVTALSGNTAGESYFGRMKDDSSAWTAGLKIGADGKLYDIATGLPLLSGALNYLPLTGGTLTGNVYLNIASGTAEFGIFNNSAPANKKRGIWSLSADGGMTWGKLNDASNAWMGGITVYGGDTVLREVSTGGIIWHSSNDGAGSGLDADLLDGYNTSIVETANTIAVRDTGGSVIAASYSARQPGGFPSLQLKATTASPSEDAIIYAYGGDTTNRNGMLGLEAKNINLYSSAGASIQTDCAIAGISMSARGWGDPGFQTLYFGTKLNWGYINCNGDSSATGNYYSAFSNACLGAVTNVVRGQGDGSGNVYASHVLQHNQWTLWVGVTDAGFSVGTVPVRYIAWGY